MINWVCGKNILTNQIQFHTDSIKPPVRVIWNNEKGVFLDEKLEEYTLEKLVKGDQFKNDAVTMWFVNQELQKTIERRDAQIEKYSRDLFTCEDKIVNSVDNMILYKKKFEDTEAENKVLTKKVKSLPLFKLGTVTFGITTLTIGTLYILKTL
jgi:hypothetical protein